MKVGNSKKTLAPGVSTPIIDEYYKVARDAGAIGGKILGAGGGGFLLLYCEDNQKKVIEALGDLKCIDFGFESEGSQIVFDEINK